MAKPAVSDSAEPAHVGDSAATGSASSTPPASGAAGSVAAADTPAAVDASEPSPRDDSRGQVGSASARPLLAPVPCHPWVWAPVIGIASGPRFPDEPLFESALELEEFFRAQSPTPPPSPDAPVGPDASLDSNSTRPGFHLRSILKDRAAEDPFPLVEPPQDPPRDDPAMRPVSPASPADADPHVSACSSPAYSKTNSSLSSCTPSPPRTPVPPGIKLDGLMEAGIPSRPFADSSGLPPSSPVPSAGRPVSFDSPPSLVGSLCSVAEDESTPATVAELWSLLQRQDRARRDHEKNQARQTAYALLRPPTSSDAAFHRDLPSADSSSQMLEILQADAPEPPCSTKELVELRVRDARLTRKNNALTRRMETAVTEAARLSHELAVVVRERDEWKKESQRHTELITSFLQNRLHSRGPASPSSWESLRPRSPDSSYSTFRASLDYFGCSGYNFVCIWRCGVGWISEPSWRPASLVSTNSSGGSAGASSATDINNPPISSPAPPARATPNPAPSPAAFASVVSTAFTKKKKKKKKKKASKPATSATAEPASSSRSVKSSQPGAKSTQSAGTKKSISPRTTGKRMAAQNARVLQALEIQTLEASDDAVLGNADGVSSTSADNPVVVGSSSASSESDQAEESASSAFHSAASSVDSDSESGDSADRSGQHLKDAKALEALRTWSTKMKDANVAYDNDDEEEEDEELENKPARPAGAVDSASAAPAASPSSRGAAKRAHHSSPSRHPRKPGRLQRLRKVNLRLSSQLRPSRLRTSQRPPSRLRLSQPKFPVFSSADFDQDHVRRVVAEDVDPGVPTPPLCSAQAPTPANREVLSIFKSILEASDEAST
ncbi:hypothetical protein PF011_g6569 [Phytophthora fragariae]|uniref:Uncharacterized protein n=1 Tax=Phytophthora fragariae TaxID=53985 RepID=A0A6A3LFA7_9STRA|nr:hypothetical protein PF011_g6569 [Phytophthora fragariae]